MLQKTIDLMECSRVFSLPTTIFSWAVIFVYSLLLSGNALYGLIAFAGLCFAHLGTNVIDDYFDYKSLIKRVDFDKTEYLRNSQKTKCRYLINGRMKETDILILALIYFGIAALIGLFLFIKCGIGVLYFAFAGGLIAVLYPFVSRICLSEAAVGLAYGPALFGGVAYVMTGTFSRETVLVSVPSMLMAIILLYIHTVMDYEYDFNEGKRTIANLFNSQLEALSILRLLLIGAYLSVIPICIFDILDWQILLVYLTLPLAVDLYRSLEIFASNADECPPHRWYHFPMENIQAFAERGEDSFMIRIYQARNLMIYFCLLFILGIVLSLAV